eukprot:3266382-Amphidinium_carterae.1
MELCMCEATIILYLALGCQGQLIPATLEVSACKHPAHLNDAEKKSTWACFLRTGKNDKSKTHMSRCNNIGWNSVKVRDRLHQHESQRDSA